ncbi:YbdD/YjiX family protein [Salinibacterium sp.]|uniref:YbdD/YjiX family protein n=1 Tax=Salinibacterium sp. TaxID=1915057 RepID=UPI002869FA83|nr:YbdD/YjiX family protein [Salinibacterium sp.]
MPAAIQWMTRRARSVSWYITSLMGDRAYDTYVDHLAARHPGIAPVDERAFWVARYREQEANPGARCC